MKRSPLQRRSKPLSRGPGPKPKPRPKLGVQERQEAQEFKLAYIGQRCVSCWRLAQVSHHVVLEQHLDPPDKWRLGNVMPLCHSCHNNHHSANGPRLSRRIFSMDNTQFAREVLGDAWEDYLICYYDGSSLGTSNAPAAQQRPGAGQRDGGPDDKAGF